MTAGGDFGDGSGRNLDGSQTGGILTVRQPACYDTAAINLT